MMNELLCKLTEFEIIKIMTEDNLYFREIDYCCGEVRACFVNKKQELLCIGEENAGDFFENFITSLKESIDNKLSLHKSIIENLGLMYNEYCHDLPRKKPKFIMVPTDRGKSSYWIGADYKIWSTYNGTDPKLTTWLYNDHQGNIIFEVTPLYKWSFLPDDLEDPDFVTYDEFMKDYKPLIHRVVPRDVAIEWLDQAMKAYRELFSSEEKYQNMCKENNW